LVRTVGSRGPKTVEAIRKAGLQLIYEHGYEAMNLRDLATQVGILPGSLYNHIRAKQGLLFELLKSQMEELIEASDKELGGIKDPVERLRAFISFHSRYYMVRKREAFIGHSELRSLTPKNYAAIIKLRRKYESRISEILEQGVEKGVFEVQDIHVTTFAILAMVNGVCNWYSPSGRLSKEDIIDIHVKLVLGTLIPRSASREDSQLVADLSHP
jgi:AcrR family transcriptional regulator